MSRDCSRSPSELITNGNILLKLQAHLRSAQTHPHPAPPTSAAAISATLHEHPSRHHFPAHRLHACAFALTITTHHQLPPQADTTDAPAASTPLHHHHHLHPTLAPPRCKLLHPVRLHNRPCQPASRSLGSRRREVRWQPRPTLPIPASQPLAPPSSAPHPRGSLAHSHPETHHCQPSSLPSRLPLPARGRLAMPPKPQQIPPKKHPCSSFTAARFASHPLGPTHPAHTAHPLPFPLIALNSCQPSSRSHDKPPP